LAVKNTKSSPLIFIESGGIFIQKRSSAAYAAPLRLKFNNLKQGSLFVLSVKTWVCHIPLVL